MSAQTAQSAPVRVLIVEVSENNAHEVDSILRDAGIATRMAVTDDFGAVMQVLNENGTDMVFISTEVADCRQLLPRMRTVSTHVPIVLMSHPEHQLEVVEGITLGATDVVARNNHEHLSLVSRRELEHVCQRVRHAQIRKALKESEQRCQLLLQGSTSAIAYIHEGMHIHANEAYLEHFGFSALDELIGTSLMDITAPESSDVVKAELKALRNGTEKSRIDFVGKRTDGEHVSGAMILNHAEYEGEHCLQVTLKNGSEAAPVLSVAGDSAALPRERDVEGFISICTSLKSEDSDYLFAVRLDDVPGLRKSLGVRKFAKLCDAVLQQLAEHAGEHPFVRTGDTECAFAVLGADAAEARAVAEKMRAEANERLIETDGKSTSATITLAAVNMAGTPASALDAAFKYLDEVQAEGPNRVVVETPAAAQATSSENTQVVDLINQAIENQKFKLLFQPIISLRGDADEHYEVFLRMENEHGKDMVPEQFLRAAIESGAAAKIDRWVILQSIKMLSVHRSKGHNTKLTINVTSNSVADPEFSQWLGVAIKAARLPSDAVIFQITELDASTHVRQTRDFVEGLRRLHCRASLSRFGLVEDPFELLRHIPVDFVKLDGSHVLESNGDSLTDLIRKLQSVGKLTVVPMVESASVLSSLWQAGANYIQGHYLQEPSTQMDYDFSTEDD